MPTVLVDTMVAAGALARQLDGKGGAEKKAEKWIETVNKITDGIDDLSFCIPTPVFYELAARNAKWYSITRKWSAVPEDDRKKLLFYINHSLRPELLTTASAYRLLCRGEKDDPKGRDRMWPDSLIAAFSLEYGHYILTTNAKDFDRRYFHVKRFCITPSSQTLYLLEPNIDQWKESTASLSA